MKKIRTRVLSGVLAAFILLSSLPVGIFAEEIRGLINNSGNGGSGLTAGGAGEMPQYVLSPNSRDDYAIWDGTVANGLSGEGSEESPFIISDGSQLMYFAMQVNGGNSYEGQYVELTKNINMDMVNLGKKWDAIGKDEAHAFKGTFDGNNHEIINLVADSIAQGADNALKNVGFFGYAQGAVISNCGVVWSDFNASFNYDTNLGGFIAVAKGCRIDNCFAESDINAEFNYVDPLERGDVMTLTKVPDSLNYTNKNGQGVIIDLRNSSTTNINKVLTVGGDVTSLRIIGDGSTYSNFVININGHSRYDFLLELVNVNITGNFSNGTIFSATERHIYIKSSGSGNSIGGQETTAVNVGSARLSIVGSADISILGGNGGSGSGYTSDGKTGNNGANGKVALIAGSLEIDTTSHVTIKGGNGGNGAAGRPGAAGIDHTGTCADGIGSSDSCAGVTGRTGETGGNGGVGGNGAEALSETLRSTRGAVKVYGSSTVTILGGNGGAGGNGGNGGNGGRGQNGAKGWISAGWVAGHNGGTGGTGGVGGNGGAGGNAGNLCNEVNYVYVYGSASVIYAIGCGGNGGRGGNGGTGGAGGSGGGSPGKYLFWHVYGGSGGTGGKGGNAGAGGNSGVGNNYNTQAGSAGTPGGGGSGGSMGHDCGTCRDNGKRPGGSLGQGGASSGGNNGGYYELVAVVNTSERQYKVHSSSVNFVTAIGTGKLISINSKEEQAVMTYVMSVIKGSYWIGLEYKSGNWRWTDGTVADYTHWAVAPLANTNGIQILSTGEWQGFEKLNTYRGYITEEKISYSASENGISIEKLSSAYLNAGGFAGLATDGTVINKCAVVVNDIKASKNGEVVLCPIDQNSNVGNLIGNISGVVTACTAVYLNGEQAYSLLLSDSWFGSKYNAISSAVLDVVPVSYSPYTDELGLTYQYFVDHQGVLYNNAVDIENKKYGNQRTVVHKLGETKEVIIPDYVYSGKFITEVSCIYQNAFEERTELSSIHLGNRVTKVGSGILTGCTRLEYITIGRSLSAKNIPEYNQGFMFGLEKFTIDEEDGDRTDCRTALKGYVVESENPDFISDSFGILYKKDTVIYPDGSEHSFETAVIDAPVNAELSEYIVPENVVKIMPYAFAYNKTLQSIDLKYVMTVGQSAFENALKLKKVSFGKPENLSEDEYYKALKNDVNNGVIADFVTSYVIDDMAFAYCKSLTDVNVDSPFIEKLGNYAFADCGDGIEKVKLGAKVNEIGFSTFGSRGGSYPTRVKAYEVDSENPMYFAIMGVLYGRKTANGSEAVLIAYPTGSSASVFEIPKIDGMVVTEISPNAFSYAWNLQIVTIEDVKIIGSGAFANSGIVKITLGKSVERFGAAVDDTAITMFENCGKLQSITVDEDNSYFSSVDGVLFDKEQTRLIKYPANKSGHDYKIPASVTVIDPFAFQNNIKLTYVEITSKLANVGMYAFYMCLNLSSIYFKDVSAPVSVGENAFATYESTMVGVKNPRTVIYYSQKGYDNSWRKWIAEKGCACEDSASTDRIHGYHFAEYVATPAYGSEDEFYNFVVLDKAGDPINYIYVQLFDSADSTEPLVSIPTSPWGIVTLVDQYDRYGVGLDLDFDKDYYLRVIDNTGEYYPLENGKFRLDEETKITYITLSSVPTVSGVNVSYTVSAGEKIKEILTENAVSAIYGDGNKTVDINSQTAKINKWCIPSMNINVRCGMDGDTEIVEYYLIQNGAEIFYSDSSNVTYTALGGAYGVEYSGKMIADIEIPVETAKLAVEKDLYVVVTMKDGNGSVSKVQTKLNIQVIDLNFVELDMAWLENGLGFTFSPELERFIKGLSGDIELIPHSPINKFAISVEEDSFKIILGVGSFDSFTDDLKDFKDTWKQLANNYKNGGKAESNKGSVGTDFFLQGILEIKYKGIDQQGEPEIELTSTVKGGLSVTFEFGSTYVIPVVFIPIRLEGEIKGEAAIELTFVFDDEVSDKLTFDEAGMELKAGLVLRAGIGCSVVSVGIYGSCELVFVIDIYPEAEVEKFTISGDVGLYAKYSGLFLNFDVKWSIVKGLGGSGELVVFENGVWFPGEEEAMASSTLALYNALLDEANYSVAQSGNSASSVLSGIENMESDAYASLSPVTLKVGDLVYIVYYEDLNGYGVYDSYNYQKIVYQTYNTKTGEYSEAKILDDNGMADGAFEIFTDGEAVAIVYSQLKEALTSDNSQTVSQYVSLTEIKTAVMDNGEFAVSDNALTDDGYYDMNPNVGMIDGKLTAVWVRNEENNMFGVTENNNMSVWYSTYSDGVWTEAEMLVDGVNTITHLETDPTGVAYITDTNNDLLTVGVEKTEEGSSDRVIHYVSMATKEIKTYTEGSYHGISCQVGELVYYKENNLYSLADDKPFFSMPIGELGEEYSVLTDENGEVKAILFIKNLTEETDGEEGSEIYGIFKNQGVWGNPIKLTSFGGGAYVSSYSATEINGEIMLAVLLSEATYIPEAGDDEDSYETTYRGVVCMCEYPEGYTASAVTPKWESAIPSQSATVTVEIANNSSVTLTEVYAEVHRNGEFISSSTERVFFDKNGKKLDGGLVSGASGYIEVEFDPGEVTTADYTVVVNGESYNFRLWYSDFAVSGKQVKIGDVYNVVVCVENKGYLTGEYTLTAVINGKNSIIGSVKLAKGEARYFTIPLAGNEGEMSSELVTVEIMADDELMLVNNKAVINVSTNNENHIDIDDLKVWMSKTSAMLVRDDIKNITFSFDDKYNLSGADVAEGVYTVNGNVVTVDGNKLAELYENGVYCLVFNFVDADGNSKQGILNVEIVDNLLSYGFKQEEDGTRYYFEDGSYAKGWQVIEGKTYRFDGNGLLFEGESMVYGSQTFWFDKEHALREGLILDEDGYRFYIGGVRQYAWQDTDGDGVKDSYFYVSSYIRCEVDRMLFDGKDTRRFYRYNSQSGHMEVVNGFYENENGTQYFKNGLGKYGWITVDGENITNKPGITLSGVYYFAYGDGLNFYMVEDASKTIGGVVREFDADHLVKAYTGWATNKTTGNANYYVEGVLQQGWFQTPEGWVYLSRSENLANNVTYGDAFTGWKKIGGKVYYFRSDSSTPAYIVISDPSRSLSYNGVRSTYYTNQTPANGSYTVGSDFYITNPPAGF